jgi:glyoxylase-like metal-dependent hydrolase (beta-lactamase superfamily II)
VVLTVLILALALVGYYRYQAPKKVDRQAPVPLLSPCPVTLAPGLHMLGGLDPAAAYVVESSDGLILIDTGLDKDAGALRGEMASLGLDWRNVRAIFLTHVHGDHSGGAEYLRAATGAKVYAGQGDAAILRAGEPREAFFSTFAIPPEIKSGPTTVDVELADEQEVRVGDVIFRALATPGHTPGSICYLMEYGGRRVLFAGDVIMRLANGGGSSDKRDRPLGTYAAYLAPRYRGDAAAFLATLRRLRTLPAPDLVLPGHPRSDLQPMSPVMTPQRWQALLDAGIAELERLQTRYASDGATFLDGTPKQLLPDLYYLGDIKGAAVYGLFTSSKFFLVDAPGGAGLGEFLAARLRQFGREPTAPAAVLLTSGNPEETAGLAGLVEASHCQVVADPAAWQAVKGSCPAGTTFLPAEELPAKGWFAVQSIPLRGRGVAPVVYLVRWAGKSVLFAGRIPAHVSPAAAKDLAADLARGQAKSDDYRAALRRLGELKPDLWLPAFPSAGQNANLYDSEWQDTLTGNEQLLR